VFPEDLRGMVREALAEGVFVDDAEGLVDGFEDRGGDPSAAISSRGESSGGGTVLRVAILRG
jgi:hypothetical protein